VVLSDVNKISGLYDFKFAFIKAFSSLLKREVRLMFDQFHRIAKLPRTWCLTFTYSRGDCAFIFGGSLGLHLFLHVCIVYLQKCWQQS